MEKLVKKYKEFIVYTGLFFAIAFFMCYLFKINGKNFIWESDGLKQHILTLFSYRNIIINTLKTGKFITFNWHIGLGFDLFANYSYYIIADIFSYITVFFSGMSSFKIYSLLVISRWFFVGIAFLCFCRHRKFTTISSVIGALMYTFSAFAFYAYVRHPFFANSVMLFPLLMIGMEKIVLENKYKFYTIIVAIIYIVSFYFAYMMSLIIAIYGIALIIYHYQSKGVKFIIQKTGQVLLYSILGILISSITLLPSSYAFFHSERSINSTIYPYILLYYRKFLNGVIGYSTANAYWGIIGVQSIVLLAFPNFIKERKKEQPMLLLLIILLIPLLFSSVGTIFDGFNFPNNRWSYVITFIFSYITVLFLNTDKKLDTKYIASVLLLISIIFLSNYIFDISVNALFIGQILILLFMIMIYVYQSKPKKKQQYILILFIIGLLLNINFIYGTNGRNYVSNFLNDAGVEEKLATSDNGLKDFTEAIAFIQQKDHSFYRISQYPFNYDNISLYHQYNAKGSYYSITPSFMQKLNVDLLNSQYKMNHGISEFDYRTKITSLLGDKYIITKNENIVPYGYSLVTDYTGSSKIYVNDHYMDFAILYTNYIKESDFDKMNALEKEDSLLKNAVIEKADKIKYS